MSIYFWIALIIVVVIILAYKVRHYTRNKNGRKSRRQKLKDFASGAVKSILQAHAESDDPTLLAFNAPQLLMGSSTAVRRLREDVRVRLIETIMAPEFNDIRLLERIVNINEDLDLDDRIVHLAPMIAGGIARNNDRMTTIMNDSQNVHDPMVIKSLNDVNKTIVGAASAAANVDNIQDIRGDTIIKIKNRIAKMLADGEINEIRARNAEEMAESMIRSNATCMSYANKKESNILMDAWVANMADENKTHNIVLGLADANPLGHSVCVNGRIGRILGSLVDPEEAKPIITMDNYRTEMYAFAGQVAARGGKADEVFLRINAETGLSDTQKAMLREEVAAGFDDDEPAEPVINVEQTI